MGAVRSPSPRGAPAAAPAPGFTLLELVIVMAILSALFGIGVGAFRSFARPERTALHQVKDTLRTARLFARAEGVPASVVVQPREGQLFTLAMRTVGNWHFEDLSGTGWPRDADHEAAGFRPDGVLGAALVLRGKARLEVSNLPPSFDSPFGFGVDVYLQPDSEGRPMTLLERPGSWALVLDRDDVLQVRLSLASTEGGGEVTEEFEHGVPAARLPADRLTRLTVVFDGRTLRVAVDGARIEGDTLFENPRRLRTAPTAPLQTGAAPGQFRGVMDELRVASVVQGDPRLLPEEAQLEGEESVVHVDASGHLDPAWHRTPLRIAFRHGAPPRRTVVQYGLLGDLTSWDEPVDASGPLDEGGATGEDASPSVEGGAR